MNRSIMVAAITGLFLGVVGDARAEPSPAERASELDERAAELTKKRDVRGALALYEEALALDVSTKRQCNVGAAYFKLDAWAPAHFFLGVCLGHTDTLPSATVVQMSKAFAYADSQLQAGSFSQIEFSVEPASATLTIPTLGKSATFTGSRTLWLPNTEHRFEASADGFEPEEHSFVVKPSSEKKDQKISISLKAVSVPVAPTDAHTDGPEPDVQDPPASHPIPVPAKASRLPAWITLSAGAGLTLVGGVFHLRAAGVRSDLEDEPTGEDRNEMIDDLKRERTIMAGFYGVGLIALGVGGYMLLSGDSDETDPMPQISLSGDAASVGVGWSF